MARFVLLVVCAEKFNLLTKGKYVFLAVQIESYWWKPTRNSRSQLSRFLLVPKKNDFLKMRG